jgi:hypothetical protein
MESSVTGSLSSPHIESEEKALNVKKLKKLSKYLLT